MNVPAGLLFGRPFHAHGATKFSFKERQRVLRRRLLPALNMFEAIGHETIVMAGHFCLSRFGGKLHSARSLLLHYQRIPRSTKSVDFCPALLRKVQ
jgi:hypothetical protein